MLLQLFHQLLFSALLRCFLQDPQNLFPPELQMQQPSNRDRSAELDPGDLIIVSGNLNLADGSEVTLTDNR